MLTSCKTTQPWPVRKLRRVLSASQLEFIWCFLIIKFKLCMFVKKENHMNDVCPSECIKSGDVWCQPVLWLVMGTLITRLRGCLPGFLAVKFLCFLPTGINAYVLGDTWRLCKHPNFCVHWWVLRETLMTWSFANGDFLFLVSLLNVWLGIIL